VTGQGARRRWIAPGRADLSERLRVAPAGAVRVELRAGRRLVGRRTLVPSLTEPAATEPDGPAAFSLEGSPGLQPPYDPEIPDYTADCSDAGGVMLRAAVPAGQSLSIDGGPARSATEFEQTVALTPGQGFRFTVTDERGEREHGVRCLPADFPTWTVTREAGVQADLLAFAPRNTGVGDYAVIADSNGVPLWWYKPVGAVPLDFKVLPGGTVTWARYPGMFGFSETTYDHLGLDGTFLGSISPVGVGADHHDLQVLPNGNRLLIGYPRRDHVDLSAIGGPSDATVVDGEIQEVTPAGELVWSWNTKDHVAVTETDWPADQVIGSSRSGPVYDIAHVNSVEVDGSGVIFSARHLNAIYRVRRDGGIAWKLGGTRTSASLDFVDDPLGAASFGGQHDARRLSDGTVTLFDNGSGRGRPPRSLRYAIDEGAGTATLLEQVVDPATPLSSCCNSTRKLPGGNWVVTSEQQGTITELTPAGRAVLTLRFARGSTYRAVPYSGGEMSRTELRDGMDAMHSR
jgi:hypothetical protein